MNRTLQGINLLGVLVLVLLCGFQWRHDRQQYLQINQLEQTRQLQDQKLSQAQQTVRGLKEDLAEFKHQFQNEHERLETSRQKVQLLDASNAVLQIQQKQVKESVTNWSRAVSERDRVIKEANDHIRKLASDLNESICKFNVLATNYNRVVNEWNEYQTNSAGLK